MPEQSEVQSQYPAGTLTRQVVTNYWPIEGGRDVGIEGSTATSRPGPEGRANRVSTMEDFRTGRSDYVTIAADPSHYDETYTIPSYTYVNARGEQHTLTNVPALVHDTGSAFTGHRRKFDIAADYSTSDSHGARLDRWNADLNRGTVFVPTRGLQRPDRGGPKPGSREYWERTRAKPSEPLVARAPAMPVKKPDAKPAEIAQAEPARVPFFRGQEAGPKPGTTAYWRGEGHRGAPVEDTPTAEHALGRQYPATRAPTVADAAAPSVPGAVVIRAIVRPA